MKATDILAELRPLGQEGYRRVIQRHGAADPCWGVKIEELKKIAKRVRTDYQFALDLYETGVYDARYLAGLIADDPRMTEADLNRWVATACRPLVGSTIPWVAAGSPHGWKRALAWIDSPKELVAAAGWATLASWVSVRSDLELDLPGLRRLLNRIESGIHSAPNAARYQMNGALISFGTYVVELTAPVLLADKKIGVVSVEFGDTECRVPRVAESLRKAEARGVLGKKRASAKC